MQPSTFTADIAPNRPAGYVPSQLIKDLLMVNGYQQTSTIAQMLEYTCGTRRITFYGFQEGKVDVRISTDPGGNSNRIWNDEMAATLPRDVSDERLAGILIAMDALEYGKALLKGDATLVANTAVHQNNSQT